jgi:hypothetical protein
MELTTLKSLEVMCDCKIRRIVNIWVLIIILEQMVNHLKLSDNYTYHPF